MLGIHLETEKKISVRGKKFMQRYFLVIRMARTVVLNKTGQVYADKYCTTLRSRYYHIFLPPKFTFFFFSTKKMNAIIERLADKGQGTIKLDLKYQPGIALVTIDNPKRHNALSGKMMVEFRNVITQLERNTNDLVAVIFMGGGSPIKSFCSGLGKQKNTQPLSSMILILSLSRAYTHRLEFWTRVY
jgi:hypothetical protein